MVLTFGCMQLTGKRELRRNPGSEHLPDANSAAQEAARAVIVIDT